MTGAREFSLLFNSGQHGRLYISCGHHARGRTFHVYVLPEGEVVREGGYQSPNAVEVYGIVGGQPGWTEYYGWLREGPWQKDFEVLVAKRRAEVTAADRARAESRQEVENAKAQKTNSVLATYRSCGDNG